jgi:hypothetical protein
VVLVEQAAAEDGSAGDPSGWLFGDRMIRSRWLELPEGCHLRKGL